MVVELLILRQILKCQLQPTLLKIICLLNLRKVSSILSYSIVLPHYPKKIRFRSFPRLDISHNLTSPNSVPDRRPYAELFFNNISRRSPPTRFREGVIKRTSRERQNKRRARLASPAPLFYCN